VRVAGKPGRRYSVDLTVWTDGELDALAQWIEIERENREERESERIWEERNKTVVSVRYVQESTRCGKPTCKCAEGELHGPYWYRIETLGNGKRKKTYHGKKAAPRNGRLHPEAEAIARELRAASPAPRKAKEKPSKETTHVTATRKQTSTPQRDARARAVRNIAVRKLR
jgi:hypothetical protein